MRCCSDFIEKRKYINFVRICFRLCELILYVHYSRCILIFIFLLFQNTIKNLYSYDRAYRSLFLFFCPYYAVTTKIGDPQNHRHSWHCCTENFHPRSSQLNDTILLISELHHLHSRILSSCTSYNNLYLLSP